MIDRQHGNIVFVCDNCDDTLSTGELDFGDAKAVLDGDGWKAVKNDGEWEHRCPECRSDGGYRG